MLLVCIEDDCFSDHRPKIINISVKTIHEITLKYIYMSLKGKEMNVISSIANYIVVQI